MKKTNSKERPISDETMNLANGGICSNPMIIDSVSDLDPLTQLRIKIATYHGWQFNFHPFGCRIITPDGRYRFASFLNSKILDFYDVPNYPQSSEDALELVEELVRDEYAVEMVSETAISYGWKVTIGCYTTEFASTLEEAICLSYLAFLEKVKFAKGES